MTLICIIGQATVRYDLVSNLLKFKLLQKFPDVEMENDFAHVIRGLGVHNIFNPSFYSDDKVKVFGFRAIPKGNDILASFISIEGRNFRKTINLSIDYYHQLGGTRLIDPKVCKLGDELYVTFNTGFDCSGNDIYVMKIHPELGSPKKLLFNKRNTQERNWSFFTEDGEIFALYSIAPLRILRLKNSGEDFWEMEESLSVNTNGAALQKLSIGTQLYLHEGKYYFVAHRKFFGKFRTKVYLGRLCVLDPKNAKIEAGRDWLIHSLRSLLGAKKKHNTALLSCTYFSGLQISQGSVRLGYGVNDVTYGFSKINLEHLL